MISVTSENAPLAAIIVAFIFLIVWTCRNVYGKWLNPVGIISIWWGGWLAVAELNLIGIPAPSLYASSMVLIALISCLLGALTGRHYKAGLRRTSVWSFQRRRGPKRINKLAPPFRGNQGFTDASRINPSIDISIRPPNRKIASYAAACVLLIAGPILWFSYLNWSLQRNIGNIADFRSDALEGVGVYGSVFGYLFYNRLVAPLLFCCILWLQCRGFGDTRKEKWLGILVVLLVIAESMGTTGRTLTFFLLIGIGYCWIFRAHRYASLSSGWSRVKIMVFSLPLVTWLIWMNQQRIGADGIGILTLSGYFTVWYHTAGFSLLDLELNDPLSRLNQFVTFGQASFGGLIEYVIIILRPLVRYDSVAYLNGIGHSEFKLLGHSDMLGIPIFGNAYYTVLYSLFQDFRWFGIVGGGFLYGRLLNTSYSRYIQFGRFSKLYLLNALLFCGMFGLFQSPLESPRFWFAMFVAYFISRVESKQMGSARGRNYPVNSVQAKQV